MTLSPQYPSWNLSLCFFPTFSPSSLTEMIVDLLIVAGFHPNGPGNYTRENANHSQHEMPDFQIQLRTHQAVSDQCFLYVLLSHFHIGLHILHLQCFHHPEYFLMRTHLLFFLKITQAHSKHMEQLQLSGLIIL